MKRVMRMQLFARVFLLMLTVLVVSALDERGEASAQIFEENFGHIGTLKMVKGQVTDSVLPVPRATLYITNVVNERNYEITANENGNFIQPDLPSGKYKIRVEANGYNIAQFTVTVRQGSPSARGKFIVVSLSPGCASGDSGVSLVSKIKKRKPEYSHK